MTLDPEKIADNAIDEAGAQAVSAFSAMLQALMGVQMRIKFPCGELIVSLEKKPS